MGKQLSIIFMIFVTFVAIYIVYQPEEQIDLNIPEKNQSNHQDDTNKRIKKETTLWASEPNTESIFYALNS
jgi:hypothetical protein